MAKHIVDFNERRSKRMFVKCPVHFGIGSFRLKGTTVNASRRGIMIKSPLLLETAVEVFELLGKEPHHRTVLELNLDGESYVTEAEVKHYHLDSSNNGVCLLRVGFGFPKNAIILFIER